MPDASCPACPRWDVKVYSAKTDLGRLARMCANARYGPTAKQLAQLEKAKGVVSEQERMRAEHLAAEHGG